MADIFISYTSSDRDWAHWLHKELEALGHTPHVHEWEIGAGDDIYAWMERRHDAADHVLCVVSDDYLKAPYSTLERNAALWQAASQRPGFVIMVAVKPCKLPTLADHLRRCELFGISEDAARDRFRTFIAAPATKVSYFPGQTFAVSNIPINVPHHFMGRDAPMEAIANALARYEGRVAITALHGLRGVGKTTLAAAYAERHRAAYRATWWIRAQTEATMRADLVALGVRLGWVEPDAKEEPGLAATMERLRHEGDGILLIYDNAIDAAGLKPYLPRGGGARVLVTSNAPTWRGLAEPVEIRLWPAQVGADYLIARTGRDAERAAAEALSNALGGLPLAHEQAAAYCERLEISLGEYGKRFAAAPTKYLDDIKHASSTYHDGLTVAKTFALAIEKATKLQPAAKPLLICAALLAPEPIPLFLFEGGAHLGASLAPVLMEDGLLDAVAALRAFALVDRELISDERDPSITTDTIRLHRLVREVAVLGMEPSEIALQRGRLACAIASVYSEDVLHNAATWPRAQRIDALALNFASLEARVAAGFEGNVVHVLIFAAQYRQSALADYKGSRSLLETALTINSNINGADHPDTAHIMNDLALVLRAQGDYEGARLLFERALNINELVSGSDDPKTAICLNNLAQTIQAQGDLQSALALFERAASIFENVFGTDHIQTATCLNNIGTLLYSVGEVAKACELIEKTLGIFERIAGAEHPHTMMLLNNLAFMRQVQGDLTNAQFLYERVIKLREGVLGDQHPDVAMSVNNLGTVLRAKRDFAGALPLFQRALAIRENVYGLEHPDTAMSHCSLGQLLRETQQLADAEEHFLKALTVCDKTLGAMHIQTQRYQSQYARLLLDYRRNAEAKQTAERALAVHFQQNGPDHPWTKDSARVTADALDALGEKTKATEVRTKYGV